MIGRKGRGRHDYAMTQHRWSHLRSGFYVERTERVYCVECGGRMDARQLSTTHTRKHGEHTGKCGNVGTGSLRESEQEHAQST